MRTIDLAYAGLGLHEELVAYVADQEGYYEAEGVHVAIRDGVSWETERLRRGATIGLGRTLLSRLTDGIEWTVLSVISSYPPWVSPWTPPISHWTAQHCTLWCGANQRALHTIAEQPRLAVDYIAAFLNRLTRDEAHQYYERYVGPYFTAVGQVDLHIAQNAIDAVAAELGVASVSATEVYQRP
jgi:hypothetical protein